MALFGRRIQHVEETREVQSEIGAVFGGAVQQVELEGFGLEDAGILSEKAKEDADQEAFELVAGVTARFQRVVQAAHDFDGLDVDRVLFFEFVLLVAGDECEVMNVLVEVGERKFESSTRRLGRAAGCAGRPARDRAARCGQNRKR